MSFFNALGIFKTILNRKWWWQTLIVILGMLFLVWLGVWQIDRLGQRRAFNARLAQQWNQAPFDVNKEPLPSDVVELEWRRVKVEGQFDYAHQIILTNQPRDDGSTGVILVTPLVMDKDRTVLVARGWVPYAQSGKNDWSQYQEGERGLVVGLIQESQTNAETAIPTEFQSDWYRIDIPAIQHQMPYSLLPVFIMQLPEPGRSSGDLPLREIPEYIQVPNEGNHLSYAIQWFMFALILGISYLQLVRTQELRVKRLQREAEEKTMVNG